MFDIFKKDTRAPEEKFWDWFRKNSPELQRFIQQPGTDYSLYKRLTEEMAKVDPAVMPELTTDDGMYVLVLTVDGVKQGIPGLERVAESFPAVPGWRIQRYRSPTPDFKTTYNGLPVDASTVRVAYQVDQEDQAVHILLLVPGFVESDNRYKGIGFLSLDHTIGEYNTMMHIGAVDFGALEAAPPDVRLLTLVELRELIEREFY